MNITYKRLANSRKARGQVRITVNVPVDKHVLAQLNADGFDVVDVEAKVVATRSVLKPWYVYQGPEVNYKVTASVVVKPSYSEAIQNRKVAASTYFPLDSYCTPEDLTRHVLDDPTPYVLTQNTMTVLNRLTPSLAVDMCRAVREVFGFINLAGEAVYEQLAAEHGQERPA